MKDGWHLRNCAARMGIAFLLAWLCCSDWVMPEPLQVLGSAKRTKVSIRTTRGDAIEGLFRGASETELSVEVAGQLIRLPLVNIRSVSFGETQDDSPNPSSIGSRGLADEALKALKEIQVATEIGLARNQYSEKLQEKLPRVIAFLDETEAGWADVKLAMRAAVGDYQWPLDINRGGDVRGWSSTTVSLFWKRARQLTDYAESLLAVDHRSHREVTDEKPLEAGIEANGRLGVGDRVMTEKIDKSSAGAFNDVYLLEIRKPGRIAITMIAEPGCAHLTLLNSSGVKLEGDMGVTLGAVSHPSTIKTQIKTPGTHYVWAGACKIGEVSRYKLKVEMQ
jgi:hypothetical protein